MTNPLPMDPFVCDACHRRTSSTEFVRVFDGFLCWACSGRLALGYHAGSRRLVRA
jgi:hypothetical protein